MALNTGEDQLAGAMPRAEAGPPRVSPLNDPKIRGWIVQAVLALVVLAGFFWLFSNMYQNLQRANVASGYGFLTDRAGFDVSQSLITFNQESTYGTAFLVGLLNTLIVAVIGIVFASLLGLIVGISRLSKNWLLAKVATVYVETLRNIPLLLQLLFWYRAVLTVLPNPRNGVGLPLGSNLNNRGLFLPNPSLEEGAGLVFLSILAAVIIVGLTAQWAKRRRFATGAGFPTLWVGLAILVVLPVGTFVATGAPISFTFPELRGFNFVGGLQITPEFLALVLGLVLYTAAFIAEIVRAGILAVSHGQTEAAHALGVRHGRTLRLVIIPQALRVIIPPLTNQYLNLTKNSSLAVAIGYPDLVAVFAGTVLNQTGQAVEVIALTMLVYLGMSLITSFFMNWFNSRMALVER